MAYVTLTTRTPWNVPLFIDSYSTMLATEDRTRKTGLFKEPKDRLKTFARHSSKSNAAFRTNLRDEVFRPWFSTFFAPEHSRHVSLFQTIICVGFVHCLSPCLDLHIPVEDYARFIFVTLSPEWYYDRESWLLPAVLLQLSAANSVGHSSST